MSSARTVQARARPSTISTALRNPGLALLVATRNDASPEVVATVLAYLVVSALTGVPYVKWRRRGLTIPEPVR